MVRAAWNFSQTYTYLTSWPVMRVSSCLHFIGVLPPETVESVCQLTKHRSYIKVRSCREAKGWGDSLQVSCRWNDSCLISHDWVMVSNIFLEISSRPYLGK